MMCKPVGPPHPAKSVHLWLLGVLYSLPLLREQLNVRSLASWLGTAVTSFCAVDSSGYNIAPECAGRDAPAYFHPLCDDWSDRVSVRHD